MSGGSRGRRGLVSREEPTQPVVPPKSISELCPWVLQRLRGGHPAVIHDVEDMPAKAALDQASFKRSGVRAHLSMPLRVAERVDGAITFAGLRAARDWPEEFVTRIGVLAEVFANALAHKRRARYRDAALTSDKQGGSYNNGLIQPFLNYNFDGGLYATSLPVLSVDWKAESGQRWTVPLGGGIGKTFHLGHAVGEYATVRVLPEFAANWQIRAAGPAHVSKMTFGNFEFDPIGSAGPRRDIGQVCFAR